MASRNFRRKQACARARDVPTGPSRRPRAAAARFLGPLAACAALLCAPHALAQSPSVALSVPTTAGLSEGKGNTTITVTATLSATRSSNTVIDLSLAGTAKASDYEVVGTLPDITVAAGSRMGTADLVLAPVDDRFFEGDETVSVGGTSTDLTVLGADIPLADNDARPEFILEGRVGLRSKLLYPSSQYHEGQILSFRLVAVLSGGSVLEEDATVTVTQDTTETGAASAADLDFGNDGPPWEITIKAGSASGSRDLSLTIVDDTARETDEPVKFDASFAAGGETFTHKLGVFTIFASDRPLTVRLQCDGDFRQEPGTTYKRSCTLHADAEAARDYTVTFTVRSDYTSMIDPGTFEFDLKRGKTESDSRAVTFTTTQNVPRSVSYQRKISPSDRGERVNTFGQNFWPAPDSSFTLDRIFVSNPLALRYAISGEIGFSFGFQNFPRPVEILGSPRVEVELDSGLISVPCKLHGRVSLTCHYYVKQGDYDLDGKIVIPAGGVKITGWRDFLDSTVTGTVATLPAQKTSFTEGQGGNQLSRIFGGSHAIGLAVSPQTLQEGAGERELTVTATNLRNDTSDSDLKIPLAFANVSTTDADWLVRGEPHSVTIPAGAIEGSTKVPFTPVDDLVREADVEIVRVGVNRGAMTSPFVRGTDIRILDAAGIRLTASPATVSENGGAQQVTVMAEWADSNNPALPRAIEIPLSWGGSAGSGDYARSGGDRVTIPANARSGSVTATITPTDDLLFEGDETISIRGSVPGRSVTTTKVTLTDNETQPAVSLSVDPTSVGEGDAAATTVTVSATLDPDVAMANGATTVTLALAGTATEGTDYTASWSPAAKTITIPAGATAGSATVSLTLTPTDDAVAEGDETITVQGTATVGGRNLVLKTAAVTLKDNDTAAVRLSSAVLSVGEGGTATYEVELGARPTGDVTVTLASGDAEVASVSPSELVFTTTNWNAPRTVTVRGGNDARQNAGGGRVTTVTHTPDGGGYGGVDGTELSVTVTDDDSALLTFDPTSLTVAEGASGTYMVALASEPSATVTLTLTAPAGIAVDTDPGTDGEQTTLSFTATDWSTPKTVTVTAADDNIHQGTDRALSISHAAAGGDYASVTGALAVTLEDDETVPVATLVLTPSTIAEGASATVTATL